MITMDWTTFLVNAPLLAGFVYFALEMNKRSNSQQQTFQAALVAQQQVFLEALEARDKYYDARNQALIQSVNANTAASVELTKQICAHDASTSQALEDILRDRSDPKKRPPSGR